MWYKKIMPCQPQMAWLLHSLCIAKNTYGLPCSTCLENLYFCTAQAVAEETVSCLQLQLHQAQMQIYKGPDAKLQAQLEQKRAELHRVEQVWSVSEFVWPEMVCIGQLCDSVSGLGHSRGQAAHMVPSFVAPSCENERCAVMWDCCKCRPRKLPRTRCCC